MSTRVGAAHIDLSTNTRRPLEQLQAFARQAQQALNPLASPITLRVSNSNGVQEAATRAKKAVDEVAAAERKAAQDGQALMRARRDTQALNDRLAREAASRARQQAGEAAAAERRAAQEGQAMLRARRETQALNDRLAREAATQAQRVLREAQAEERRAYQEGMQRLKSVRETQALNARIARQAALQERAADKARADEIDRVRLSLSRLRAGYDDGLVSVGKYHRENLKLLATIREMGQRADFSTKQLKQLADMEGRLAREGNTVAGVVNPAGLSGNVATALQSVLPTILGNMRQVASLSPSLGAAASQVFNVAGAFGKAATASTALTTGAGAAGGAVTSLGGATATLGGAATVATAGITALVGVTVAAAAAANKAVAEYALFERGLAQVATLTDKTTAQLAGTGREVLNISMRTGATFQELNAGLYDILGAGVKGSEDMRQSLVLLEQSAKLAKAGATDTATATDVLTSVLNSYNMTAGEAGKVSDQLFQAVLDGKMSFDELARSLGMVTPLAAQAGIGLDEVLAAVAALTAQGIRPSSAVEYLRSALTNIIKPSEQAAGIAEDLKLQFGGQALAAKGLVPFLQDVMVKTKGDSEAMARLFGDVGGVTAVMALANGEFGRVNQTLANQAASAGATATAYGKMADTIDEKTQQVGAKWKALWVSVGELFAPTKLAILEGLDDILTRLNETLDKFMEARKLNAAGQNVQQLEYDLKGRRDEKAAALRAMAEFKAQGKPIPDYLVKALKDIDAAIVTLNGKIAEAKAVQTQLRAEAAGPMQGPSMPTGGNILQGIGIAGKPVSQNFGLTAYSTANRGAPGYEDGTHKGLDIALPRGTKLLAPVDAKITFAGWNNQGYGNLVKMIDSAGRTILMAHLDEISADLLKQIKAGNTTVKAGTLLGKSGSTGNSTGDHLHLETRDANGQVFNPYLYGSTAMPSPRPMDTGGTGGSDDDKKKLKEYNLTLADWNRLQREALEIAVQLAQAEKSRDDAFKIRVAQRAAGFNKDIKQAAALKFAIDKVRDQDEASTAAKRKAIEDQKKADAAAKKAVADAKQRKEEQERLADELASAQLEKAQATAARLKIIDDRTLANFKGTAQERLELVEKLSQDEYDRAVRLAEAERNRTSRQAEGKENAVALRAAAQAKYQLAVEQARTTKLGALNTATAAVTAAQEEFNEALEEGTRAGNAALANLDSLMAGSSEAARANAQTVIPSYKTFDALLSRITSMQGDLQDPVTLKAWVEVVQDFGAQGRLTEAHVAALIARIHELAEAPINEINRAQDQLAGENERTAESAIEAAESLEAMGDRAGALQTLDDALGEVMAAGGPVGPAISAIVAAMDRLNASVDQGALARAATLLDNWRADAEAAAEAIETAANVAVDDREQDDRAEVDRLGRLGPGMMLNFLGGAGNDNFGDKYWSQLGESGRAYFLETFEKFTPDQLATLGENFLTSFRDRIDPNDPTFAQIRAKIDQGISTAQANTSKDEGWKDFNSITKDYLALDVTSAGYADTLESSLIPRLQALAERVKDPDLQASIQSLIQGFQGEADAAVQLADALQQQELATLEFKRATKEITEAEYIESRKRVLIAVEEARFKRESVGKSGAALALLTQQHQDRLTAIDRDATLARSGLAKTAEDAQKQLAAAEQEYAQILGATQPAYQSQINNLTEMADTWRKERPEIAAQIDLLIGKYRELQKLDPLAQAFKAASNAMGRNSPLQAGLSSALDGLAAFFSAGGKAGGRGAILQGAAAFVGGLVDVFRTGDEDIDRVVSTFVSGLQGTLMQLAQGNWIGALVTGVATVVATIIDIFQGGANSARKAAEEIRNATQNVKFFDLSKYAKTVSAGGFWGFLGFRKSEIDQEAVGIAQTLGDAIYNAISTAFLDGIKSGKASFSDLGLDVRKDLGQVILQGLIDGFMKGAVMQGILQPFLDAYMTAMKSGNAEALTAAANGIQAALGTANTELARFYDTVLVPASQQMGVFGTETGGGLSGSASTDLGIPTVPGAVMAAPAWKLDEMQVSMEHTKVLRELTPLLGRLVDEGLAVTAQADVAVHAPDSDLRAYALPR